MHLYYLYSKVKEVNAHVINSLSDYDITTIDDSSKLFDIDSKEDAILLLHVDSYDQDICELVEYLLKDIKDLKIFALSNRVSFSEGVSLLQAGVKGYGNTYMHDIHLYQAVDIIASGNLWIYPELALHLIKNLTKAENVDESRLDSLSEHERECALLAAEGNSNNEIATLLDRQEITVKKHLSSVYKKLGIKNRMELALYLK